MLLPLFNTTHELWERTRLGNTEGKLTGNTKTDLEVTTLIFIYSFRWRWIKIAGKSGNLVTPQSQREIAIQKTSYAYRRTSNVCSGPPFMIKVGS